MHLESKRELLKYNVFTMKGDAQGAQQRQPQPQKRSLEDVERLMFTDYTTIGVCKYTCVLADRVRLRHMMEDRNILKQDSMVQARPHPLLPLLTTLS